MSRDRRTTPRLSEEPTPEEKRRRLEEEWDAISAQRAALNRLEDDLARRTPGDVRRPIRLTDAAVPVKLPLRFIQGLVVGFVTLTVSIVGAATALYYKTQTHIGDPKVHVMEEDGIPTMVKRQYETAERAAAARETIVNDVETEMAQQHEELKDELVRVIAPQRYRQWRRERARERASAN